MKFDSIVITIAIMTCGACADAPGQSGTEAPPGVAAVAEQLRAVGRDAHDHAREQQRCFRFHWVVKDERASFVPDDDVDLIDALVPHHEMALMMAEMEIDRGISPEVVTLAQRMLEMQMREIDELRAIREEITGCSDVPPLHEPHHDVDMAEIEAAEGIDVDREFIEHMIPHHASAIAFSHAALPNLAHEALRQMAQSVVDAQSAEICEMRELMASL